MVLPKQVVDVLISFIFNEYPNKLQNSLLIAQAFILKYPVYGREYGLPIINKAVEEGIERGFFKKQMSGKCHMH
jgi:hypothetical protein